MTEIPEGQCKFCGNLIGLAVKTHEQYCQSINNVTAPAAAAIQHDSDAAAHGKCKCPLCDIDADGLSAWV